MLPSRRVLDVDLEPIRRGRGLKQRVLRTVPVIPALDPLGNGCIIEGVILEIDLRDRPCRMFVGMSANQIRHLLAQERPSAIVLDLGNLDS